MIYYVLVLFCQKTTKIYIPLSLNCKYMMNQNSSGFLSSIPMVTKNLIIINLLFWVASFVLPKVGIDLVQSGCEGFLSFSVCDLYVHA